MAMKNLKTRLSVLALVTLSCLTASCAHLTNTRETEKRYYAKETVCDIFRPIRYSRWEDTIETVRQVQAHNDIYKMACIYGGDVNGEGIEEEQANARAK